MGAHTARGDASFHEHRGKATGGHSRKAAVCTLSREAPRESSPSGALILDLVPET